VTSLGPTCRASLVVENIGTKLEDLDLRCILPKIGGRNAAAIKQASGKPRYVTVENRSEDERGV
jgi:hypothetical protein